MQSDKVTAKLVRRIFMILLAGLPMVSEAYQADTLQFFTRAINRKQYELQDHLGNVRAVVSDVKIPLNLSNPEEGFKPTLLAATHYDPFGMELPDRSYSSEKYRYGFNGKEKDDEWKGTGNSYNFDARIYDPRIGRWLSTDPLDDKYPSMSPYNFAVNNPVIFVDPDGKEVEIDNTISRSLILQTVLNKATKNSVYKKYIKEFSKEYSTNEERRKDYKKGKFLNLTFYLADLGEGNDNVVALTKNLRVSPFAMITFNERALFLNPGVSETQIFGALIHELLHTTTGKGLNDHENMAENYGIIVDAMREYDKANGITGHTDAWYDAVAIEGLPTPSTWSDEKIAEVNNIIKEPVLCPVTGDTWLERLEMTEKGIHVPIVTDIYRDPYNSPNSDHGKARRDYRKETKVKEYETPPEAPSKKGTYKQED